MGKCFGVYKEFSDGCLAKSGNRCILSQYLRLTARAYLSLFGTPPQPFLFTMGLLFTVIIWALGISPAVYGFQVIRERLVLADFKRKEWMHGVQRIPPRGFDPWTRLVLRHGQGNNEE